MCDSLLNPSGLKFLWKRRGNKDYDLKTFIYNGTFIQYMVFEDRQKSQKVLGKIVASPREGEAYHWPRLQHENLAPLLDIVSINETKSIYIFPCSGKNIGNVIHDDSFLNDSECFNKKKAYVEDILWALDYLHQKSLCLMNLTELIIYICDAPDKAVICDFSCVFLIERATNEKIQLPALYQAPEINTEDFQPTAVETWACGVMLLQIFTGHCLPSAFVGNEVHQVFQAVREINYDIIKEANPGCQLHFSDIENLRKFLDLFLVQNPKQRVKVQLAAVSSFLRCSRRRTKIKDDNTSEQLIESAANTAHTFQVWEKSNIDMSKNSVTFKDIYLKEAAKYRDKLKQEPCTHTFINLDFVPDEDTTKESDENQYCIHRKSSKVNRIAEMVSSDVTQSSDADSEKSVIGDNGAITSKLSKYMINDSFVELAHETDPSKSEEILNTFGDVSTSTVQRINEYPHFSYLDGHEFSDISISTYGDESVIKDILDDYDKYILDEYQKELFESKSNFSSRLDISSDSLESEENVELSLLSTLDKSNETDLNFQNNKIFARNSSEQKNIAKFLSPRSRTQHFRSMIHTKVEIIKSDSNLRNTRAHHKMNLTPSRSDSCIVNLPDAKYKNVDNDFSDLTFFCGNSDSNNSKQIMLLDNKNLNKKSNNVMGYNWQSHGIKSQPKEKTLLPSQTKFSDPYIKSRASHLKLNDCSHTVHKELLNQNGCNLVRRTDSLRNLKPCNERGKNTKVGDVSIIENMKDSEVILKTPDCSQCVAISETDNHTDSLFSKLKKMTAPFKKLTFSNKFRSKKKTDCSCSSKRNEYDYPWEDELAVEQNPSTMTIFEHIRSESMDISLLNNIPREFREQSKNPTKKKKKWFQCLCLGSRTH